MKAMVLTAGIGARMLPLTLICPKPAIPVLGRPMVLQHLKKLCQAGVGEAVLNLHHLPDAVRQAVADGGHGSIPEVSYTFEHRILGTAGGIHRAAPMLRGEGPIVVCNADFLADIDVAAALATHRETGRLATLVLAPWREGYSRVKIDGDGRVVALAEGVGEHMFTGAHVIGEALLDRLPAAPSCIVRDVYRELAAEGQLGSFLHRGLWWEFGSPEAYLEGSLQLIDLDADARRAVAGEHDPVRRVDGATAAVGPGAAWDPGARLRGRVALGLASHLSERTEVRDCVIMPEAWVGPGCRLRDVVVGPGTELPAGLELERTLVCSDTAPGGDLPPDTRRERGLLLRRLDADRG